MDEPLSNLDAKLRLETRSEIRRIHRELDRTTIYVTHDQDEALSLADRIVVIEEGRVQQVATPQDGLRAAREPRRRALHGLPQRAPASGRTRGRRSRDGRARSGVRLHGLRKQALADRRAAVAMRPEDIVVGEGADGVTRSPASSTYVEYCGRDSLVDFITQDGTRLHVRTAAPEWRSAKRRASTCRPSARSCIRRADRWQRRRPDKRSRVRAFDRALLLVVPAAAFMLLLFVYPFLYGLFLSFEPKEALTVDNYRRFFSDERLWPTIWTTLRLALPVTIINVFVALPIAYKMRIRSRYQRFVTTVLVMPITLGTVLIAEGMLTYFGPKGWLSQFAAVPPSLRRPHPPDAQLLGRADLARRSRDSHSRSC